MDVWKPEYKTWLSSLKAGDVVAVKDRTLQGGYSEAIYGYQLYTVRYITPKRTRFDCWLPDLTVSPSQAFDVSLRSEVSFDREGLHRIRSMYCRESFWLQPVTPEISQSIIDDDNKKESISSIKKLARHLEAMLERGPWRRPTDELVRMARSADEMLAVLNDQPNKVG
jgi:hypothetical protein